MCNLYSLTTNIEAIRALVRDFRTAESIGNFAPDAGVTNVRNTDRMQWTRWLERRFRCVVPFTSFSEFDGTRGPDGKKLGDTWFAFHDSRPLAFFAGIWAPQWTSVRKVREGVVTTDLFAFLTTTPNDVVGAIHPKAVPVIFTTPEEIETWMTAPWSQARTLQRPLPDGVLRFVARGVKEEGPPPFCLFCNWTAEISGQYCALARRPDSPFSVWWAGAESMIPKSEARPLSSNRGPFGLFPADIGR